MIGTFYVTFQVQHVNQAISCVRAENVFQQIGYVIGFQTARMAQTRKKQHVPCAPLSFSAQMDCAWPWKKFVMEQTTVVITVTKIRSVSVSHLIFINFFWVFVCALFCFILGTFIRKYYCVSNKICNFIRFSVAICRER